MKKVFVVMSNDYPDCVFDTADAAGRYVKKRMDEQRAKIPEHERKWNHPRIYYQSYTFTVNEEGRRHYV